MIAALYVQKNGAYFGLDGVDPWDEARDARLYAGPWSVVAHPPCARWCRLAGLVEARWGHKRGEDGGCFASALNAVRTWGGVLEHPAYSDAWTAFGLPLPETGGGWHRGICGGWSCHVEQGRYGHPAKKATWLYAFGCDTLPSLRWGSDPDQKSKARAAATPPEFRAELLAMARSVRLGEVGRLTKPARSATPPQFRDVLLGIAGSVTP